MSSILESIKSVKNPFSSSDEPEPEPEDDDTNTFFREAKKALPKLSYKERVIGFCISVGVAAGLALLGCALAGVSAPAFAVLFILGTIAGIISTFFLVNPLTQLKTMFDPSDVSKMVIKLCCAITIFVMIVMAFCAAFWWQIGALSIFFCVIEFVALIVYAITLIPYATTIITKGVKSAFGNL